MYNSEWVDSMIYDGENVSVDFKLSIDLGSAYGKSEFIKDLVALANSVEKEGYLIIGVDDNGHKVGIDLIEEERIQQIASTYITPPIKLTCHQITLEDSLKTFIGIIQVKPSKKPHKVARTTDKLLQNDVFVRHGTVVGKASPEEVIAMDHESTVGRHYHHAILIAETHFELGNYLDAVNAYSKAIQEMPTPEAYLERGKVFRFYSKTVGYEQGEEFTKKAVNDLTNAIKLSDNIKLEIEARLLRARIQRCGDLWKTDIDWLKQNAEGVQLGETYYLEALEWGEREAIYYTHHNSAEEQELLNLINTALELGYQEPEVFLLRAEAYTGGFNYGLALKDVNQALSMQPERQDYYYALNIKTYVLMKMGQHDQVYAIFQEAQLRGFFGSFSYSNYLETSDIRNLCCQLALYYEFADHFMGYSSDLSYETQRNKLFAKRVIKFLGAWKERIRDHEHNPKVLGLINKIIAEDTEISGW